MARFARARAAAQPRRGQGGAPAPSSPSPPPPTPASLSPLFPPRFPCPPASLPRPLIRSVKLKAFYKFEDTAEALAATSSLIESKMGKTLKSFLKTNMVKKEVTEELGVADAKLGGIIKEKLGLACVADSRVNEMMRGIRSQMASLIEGLDSAQLRAMQLGLGHTLSRYKLKFSPDKVDTMIVQAIGLLDDLDKEVNVYAMRTKEWYGWHFPEMAKVINDNLHYAKVILKMGFRCVAPCAGSLRGRPLRAPPKAPHPCPRPPLTRVHPHAPSLLQRQRHHH